MQDVYLICGVSGSGKSWVCRQLAHKFFWVPHDEHFNDHAWVIKRACIASDKPVITECPFGERVLKEQIEKYNGIRVIPYFVIEHPDLVAKRYMEREKKELPKNAYTRASSIIDRALEWRSFYGTSEQVLSALKALPVRQ